MTHQHIQIPSDVSFDFNQPLQRIQYLRSKVGKYNEVTRDFLDEIQIIQEHLEYLSYNNRLLAIVFSGPKKNEWEQRLTEANDYLNKLETYPAMGNYDKSIEDELVKVANNLEEISTEIHSIWSLKKGRPLEPVDIFEALHIHQQLTPLHGNIQETWKEASPDIKQYCEQLANALGGTSERPKPKREKGMGRKAEEQPQAQPTYGQAQAQPIYAPSQVQPTSGQPQPTYGQPQPTYEQPQPTYGQPQFATAEPSLVKPYVPQQQPELFPQPFVAQQAPQQPSMVPPVTAQPFMTQQPGMVAQPVSGQPSVMTPEAALPQQPMIPGEPVIIKHERKIIVETGSGQQYQQQSM